MSSNQNKIRYRDLLSKKELILIGAFFLIVLGFLYYTFFTPNYYKEKGPLFFEVSRGETVGSIASHLHQKGVIKNEFYFKVASKLYGADKKLKAARYHIPNGLSYFGLIDYFVKGNADFLREVKIFDGSSVSLIASRLKTECSIDSAEFIKYVRSPEFLKKIGNHISSPEGYLLPDNYFIYERSTVMEAADSLYAGMQRYLATEAPQDIHKGTYSLHQKLTLASIVNGETNKYDEMPRIAGVYYNRLRVGMRLQADPTIQYILRDKWRRLSYDDLRINNPYNTYMFAGLPPGPINNPGKKAILAAVYPEKNDYFYFVSDGKGGHKFARTFSEHLKNIKEFRSLINK